MSHAVSVSQSCYVFMSLTPQRIPQFILPLLSLWEILAPNRFVGELNSVGTISDTTLRLFSTGQKTHLHPLTSGFCLQWERLQSVFTPRSNDSAVDTGFYQLGLRSAQMET